MSTLVIAADPDPLSRRVVAQSLAWSEFEPKVTGSGEEAWSWAQSAPAPVVLLYGWSLPDVAGAELCHRLRRTRAPRERYVIATLGPREGTALVSTIEEGADDVLVKPFSAEVLLSRLRLAASRCASPERRAGTLREALHEALESKMGGEVVVRSGQRVGRVHVSEAGIAWAKVSGMPVRLGGLMHKAGVALSDEDMAAVVEESRRLKVHFADVLVRWGYLDEAGARECVRAVVAEQLDVLLALPDATALFLPQTQAYDSQLSFQLEELAPGTLAPPPSRGPTAAAEPQRLDRLSRYERYTSEAVQTAGAIGAAVLDRATGVEWVSTGAGVEGEVAWSLLGALAALGTGAEDVIAVRDGAAFVGRAIDATSALVAAFSPERTTLGLARMLMKQLVPP